MKLSVGWVDMVGLRLQTLMLACEAGKKWVLDNKMKHDVGG